VATFPSEPNFISATAWSRNAIAKVATSIVAGGALRSGRKTATSISSDSAITTAKHVSRLAQSGQPCSLVTASENAPAMISWP